MVVPTAWGGCWEDEHENSPLLAGMVRGIGESSGSRKWGVVCARGISQAAGRRSLVVELACLPTAVETCDRLVHGRGFVSRRRGVDRLMGGSFLEIARSPVDGLCLVGRPNVAWQVLALPVGRD